MSQRNPTGDYSRATSSACKLDTLSHLLAACNVYVHLEVAVLRKMFSFSISFFLFFFPWHPSSVVIVAQLSICLAIGAVKLDKNKNKYHRFDQSSFSSLNGVFSLSPDASTTRPEKKKKCRGIIYVEQYMKQQIKS